MDSLGSMSDLVEVRVTKSQVGVVGWEVYHVISATSLDEHSALQCMYNLKDSSNVCNQKLPNPPFLSMLGPYLEISMVSENDLLDVDRSVQGNHSAHLPLVMAPKPPGGYLIKEPQKTLRSEGIPFSTRVWVAQSSILRRSIDSGAYSESGNNSKQDKE